MNTARRMSGRSSSSAVGPANRTSPFSRNTRPLASSSATLTDCSTTTTVVPGGVDLPHLLDQLVDHGRGQAERQLVDAEQLGPGDERHGQRQHLLLAARQVAGQLVVPLRRGPGTCATDLGARRRGGVLVVAQHPARQAQVLGDGQGREHALAAGHQRQAQPGDLLGRQAGDVAPVEGDAAPLGGSSPAIALSTVDLPAPLVPSRARISSLDRRCRRRTAPGATRRPPRGPRGRAGGCRGARGGRCPPSARRPRRRGGSAAAAAGLDGLLDGLDVVDSLEAVAAARPRRTNRSRTRSKAWARPPGMTSRMTSRPTPVSSSWAWGNR